MQDDRTSKEKTYPQTPTPAEICSCTKRCLLYMMHQQRILIRTVSIHFLWLQPFKPHRAKSVTIAAKQSHRHISIRFRLSDAMMTGYADQGTQRVRRKGLGVREQTNIAAEREAAVARLNGRCDKIQQTTVEDQTHTTTSSDSEERFKQVKLHKIIEHLCTTQISYKYSTIR